MSSSQYQYNLNIADFKISVLSDFDLQLEEGYVPFLAEFKQADIFVTCYNWLPDNLFQHVKPVFEAENSDQKFYTVYSTDKGLGFIIYNQQQKNTIQQIALLDHSFTKWTIYCLENENGFMPLRYPMGPIVMHYMTLKSNAVMLHASCAYDGERGRIFTGFSGVGKSTMSKIWLDAGSLIVNDDRLIVREENGAYFVHNTPMYYKDMPKKAPLHSIFLISHSPVNRISKLQGALAISRAMAFSIQNNFDRQFIQSRLAFFSDLSSKTDIYDLGFVPDNQVISFIKNHETGGTK